ncbi:MAG: thioredoxin domain-containing protein [Candidatus Kaiserbacteria bacterium]|nr:thioredoxin domain-containing protein [Candidatus Kaiserbacteria bacterium]
MDTLQKFSVPLAIIIAGALIAGAVYFVSISKTTVGLGAPSPKVNIKDVKTDGDPFIGNSDAPVVLAYWSDHQCPYCKAVEVGGIPQIPLTPAIPVLIKDYVDAGKLKIVFKDYPFLGPDSMTAALYEHAVWELYPDKFYEWRKALMLAQDEENGGFGNEESIVALTNAISGMDGGTVKALVAKKTDAYTKSIEEDKEEGASFGIQGTPGFIIGTKLIAGAADPSAFKTAIEEQLRRSDQ